MPLVPITLSLMLFVSAELFAQETLVKDINTTPAGMRPGNDYSELFCECGDYLFFNVPGKELWRTDGTSEGTISLGDIYKGYTQGVSGLWTMACTEDKTLFFVANDGISGWELWRSDGSPAGTKMIKDATTGNNMNWGIFIELGLIGNTYYFIIDHDDDKQLELWKSNGTESTTVMVPDFPAFSSVRWVMSSDTHHFFRTQNPVTKKYELWVTDGTGANTLIVMEDYYQGPWENMGTKVMFSLNDRSDNTNSLWESDGTISGTVKVKDFGTQYLQRFERFNDKLIFGVYSDTWISDGTEVGTTFLSSGSAEGSITVENNFYALGYDFSTGFHRILRTDGTAVEISNLNDSEPFTMNMYHTIPIVNDNMIIQYFDESVGEELGIFDMTSRSFNLLMDINAGVNSSSPKAWATLNNKVYFLADDGAHGMEIWTTDGTAEGTYLLKDVNNETGSAFRSIFYSAIDMAVSDEKLQLLVEPQEQKLAIYASDGTEEGTTQKIEFNVASATMFGRTNADLIYFNDRKFYKTNGATHEVTLIKDLSNDITSLGYTSIPHYTLGDKLIFRFGTYSGNIAVGDEFWVTDGTEAGTHVLKDINPGTAAGVTNEAAVLESKIVFQGTTPESGAELWASDGTTDGTVLIKDINPGVEGSSPQGFATLGNKVIFSATESMYGNELWITDGTTEGTMLLADIVPGPAGSEPRHFRVGNNVVYFSAYDVENGWSLWKTEGTALTTNMVIDVIPGTDQARVPNNLKAVGDKFYFAANDGLHGQELWVTDGTEEGTHIIDVLPGVVGSNPTFVSEVNGVAYFKADASLWRTNGREQGTFKVSGLEPFNIASIGNWVYFTAFHPDYGIELFRVEFTKLDQEIATESVPTKTFGDVPFQLIASATSGLPVTITSSDELTIEDNVATIVKPGTVVITLRQGGDALFNAAEVSQTFCVLPSKPTITVSGLNTGEPVLTSSAATGNQWFEQDVEIGGANEQTFNPEQDGTFKVNVTIEGCTGVFSDEEVILVTGVENPEDLLILYPNPATQHLRIQTTGYGQELQVVILDLQGKPLDGFQIKPNVVFEHSLQDYPSGIYLVKIVTESGISYHKFVKE